jgi:hypothetical protein
MAHVAKQGNGEHGLEITNLLVRLPKDVEAVKDDSDEQQLGYSEPDRGPGSWAAGMPQRRR